MAIKKEIFKAYDIRGKYPEEVNEAAAYEIGKAAVDFFKAEKFLVAMDARLSSPALFRAFCSGVTEEGCDVVDMGVCTNPMCSTTVVKHGFKAGCIISASHSPPEFNGFKFFDRRGLQLSDKSGLEKIRNIAEENIRRGRSGKELKKAKAGKIVKKDFLNDYVERLLGFCKGIRRMRVVVDAGNGVGGIPAKALFGKLKQVELFPLYFEPDGNFPNHEPNPMKSEVLEALRKTVIEKKADFGACLDGDSDRVIFVDEKAQIISSDYLTAFFADMELKDRKKGDNKSIYFDLRFSRSVEEVIRSRGGKPVRMRVGNPFYKEKLVNEGGIFAAELSGHIMFAENYCMDDGLFAIIKMMGHLSKTDRKLSSLITPYKRYSQSPEINVEVRKKDEAIAAVEKEFSKGKISRLDGITVEFGDFWFNIRKSNTEDLIRIRIEADTDKKVEEVKQRILLTIARFISS